MVSLRDAEINDSNSEKNTFVGQYLNPEAMLTPGLAGALVMMITNGLASNFAVSRPYTGLFLSFALGLLVLVTDRRWWLRAVYYVINSLIIFCVAFGANGLGVGVARTPVTASILSPISAAFAESPAAGAGNSGAAQGSGRQAAEPSAPTRAQLEDTIRQQQQQLERYRQNSSAQQQTGFFAPWFK